MGPTANQLLSEPLLTEQQVAELLNISVASLRRRRLLRRPPDFIKIGSSVRYRRQSVELLVLLGEQKLDPP
jgi:hypothetical protein